MAAVGVFTGDGVILLMQELAVCNHKVVPDTELAQHFAPFAPFAVSMCANVLQGIVWQDWADGCVEIAAEHNESMLLLCFRDEPAQALIHAFYFRDIMLPGVRHVACNPPPIFASMGKIYRANAVVDCMKNNVGAFVEKRLGEDHANTTASATAAAAKEKLVFVCAGETILFLVSPRLRKKQNMKGYCGQLIIEVMKP